MINGSLLFLADFPYGIVKPFGKGSMMKLLYRMLPVLAAALIFGGSSAAATDFDLLPPPVQADFSPYRMTVPLEAPMSVLKVSSPFGWRFHPDQRRIGLPYGIDLEAAEGTEIRAVMAGEVQTAGFDPSYGNYVVLDHFHGFTTLYAHCSRLLVQEGDRVRRGQVIAKVGATGDVTGPHLHLELRMNGIFLNPAGGHWGFMIEFYCGKLRVVIKFSFFAVLLLMLELLKSDWGLWCAGAGLLHEVGHLLAYAAVGAVPREISFECGGIRIVPSGKLLSPGREAVVLAAGSSVNLIVGGLLMGLGTRYAAGFHLLLGCFNLLPAEGRGRRAAFRIIDGAIDGPRRSRLDLPDCKSADTCSTCLGRVAAVFPNRQLFTDTGFGLPDFRGSSRAPENLKISAESAIMLNVYICSAYEKECRHYGYHQGYCRTQRRFDCNGFQTY